MELLTVKNVAAILKVSQSLVYGLIASGKTIRRAFFLIDYVFRWLEMQFSETYRQQKLVVYGCTSDHQPPIAS